MDLEYSVDLEVVRQTQYHAKALLQTGGNGETKFHPFSHEYQDDTCGLSSRIFI
jgi:hypothetical protein